MRLITEMTLIAGTHPMRGHVRIYTRQEMLEGLHTDNSTLPPGRSSNQQRRVCWKGQPKRMLKDAFLITCA